ncbi:MAG: hypothetical protein IJL78_02525 [Lachnospiraceae bacterium]|nr:hypothetical protein [Lachnospiraceae bacterium]
MFDTYGQYIIIALAVYCIFMGVRTLLTGRTGSAEEAKIKDFTERAQKKYRLVSALMNILAGIFLVVVSIIRLTNPEMDKTVYRLVSIGILVVLVAVYIITWQVCKKDK